MDAPTFYGLLIVVTVAFAVPFTLGLLPRVKPPSVVLELVGRHRRRPGRAGSRRDRRDDLRRRAAGARLLRFLVGLEIEFSTCAIARWS
jgi:hypothetical protein